MEENETTVEVNEEETVVIKTAEVDTDKEENQVQEINVVEETTDEKSFHEEEIQEEEHEKLIEEVQQEEQIVEEGEEENQPQEVETIQKIDKPQEIEKPQKVEKPKAKTKSSLTRNSSKESKTSLTKKLEFCKKKSEEKKEFITVKPLFHSGEELLDDIPFCIFDISLTEKKSRLAVKFSTKDGKIFVPSFEAHTDLNNIIKIVSYVIEVKPERLKHEVMTLKLRKQELIDEFKSDPHDSLPCMSDYKSIFNRFIIKTKYEELVIPDYMCVNVKDSTTNASKCILVEYYNRAIEKPWDGGYRNPNTGVEYHNGFSQTGPRAQVRDHQLTNRRDTQTSWYRNRKIDMPYSQATQMFRSDLFIPCITDKVIISKPYETAEEREKRLAVDRKVRTIQRYYRAWKMRKCLKELSHEYHLRKRLEMEREQMEIKDDWCRRRKDLISQVFPRTHMDFGMLYAMAEKWKNKEIERISTMYCGPAKIAELALLSDKEIEVFRGIDKLQQEVKRDNDRQNALTYLSKLGKPKRWYCSYKHIPIELDSLENQKAREIDVLYQKVVDRNVCETKRIDALLELKLSLKNDDCEIAIELNKLVDRAVDLLSRGFSKNKIESLQRRIEASMMHHFKQKECFEMLVDLQEKEREKYMKDNLFICARCQQMKTINCFKINARTEKINICNTCKWLDKTLEPWADLSPYRFILNQVRYSERTNNSPCSLAYILQDRDMYHLVTQIWHSHSAISECKDVYNLRLVRWYRDIDWSPWNCILLTLEEGKQHVKIKNLEDVYEQEFINHIFNKHALAKKHFKDLQSVEYRFKSLYKVSSVHNLDPNGYNDYRKMFYRDRTRRQFF